MRAEHAPEERLVAPISWATLGVHVVASPGSHAALEVGGLSVHSFGESSLFSISQHPDARHLEAKVPSIRGAHANAGGRKLLAKLRK